MHTRVSLRRSRADCGAVASMKKGSRQARRARATKARSDRPFDLICLGRLEVDFYSEHVGAKLEDASSFAKYLGGSPARVAFGVAGLGLRTAMVSRVGDDPMGRFLVDTLQREGCDTKAVKVDKEHSTGLAFIGFKDRHTFPLSLYRNDCADMALCGGDIKEDLIASSRALLLSGTHLSNTAVLQASTRALEFATKHGLARVLDIDYCPALWGLTGKAEGGSRYAVDGSVSRLLQRVLPEMDLVFGTEEEFRIAGGAEDLVIALRRARKITPAALVVKLDAQGCLVFRGPIPERLADVVVHQGIAVEVLNAFGGGDGFAAGFLYGWLIGKDDERCCQLGNLYGSMTVSRDWGVPTMPTRAQIDHLLNRSGPHALIDRDGTHGHLHIAAAERQEWGPLYIFAFDHRRQLIELAQQVGRELSLVTVLKRHLFEALALTAQELRRSGDMGSVGLLADDRFAQDVLNDATGRGWWIARPVEAPSSRPLVFAHGRSVGTTLARWPREQIVKCLVSYHPDDEPTLLLEQEAQLKTLYDATRASGHELLLEVIPPTLADAAPDALPRALQRLYDIGIYPEWWKLLPQPSAAWKRLEELIGARDPYCRGVVLLGSNARAEDIAKGFREAAGSPICRGFAVGRAIFQDPAAAWLKGEIDAAQLIARVRASLEYLIGAWRDARGLGSRPSAGARSS